MKKLFLITVAIISFLTSCDSTIGKYKKEALPDDFTYKVIEDNSDEALEKNQLTIEINKKITIEQIASLADKLFSSKPKQRRFYIFYLLPGMKSGSGAWAISHFDPDLDIQIIGSSVLEDQNANKISDAVIDEEIIGKWREEQYTSSNYIIYKNNNKIFIKTIFKSGGTSDEELKEQKVKKGIRYDYKASGYNGEYFILNAAGELEFYNSENKNFTTATKNK
ncbi:MAG: hypothetical protein J7604_20065 [Sporocytophaga sp.]|uniref:hypothetical protein n=1 Tax=Sporocytophaga sp. TaxID=2231183 RepID=UPI001B2CF222|nr:hypothetical protein [Sporocytophaga sp.]MBO9702517.1 hypothetical protein [Sporocytophaga sp.]